MAYRSSTPAGKISGFGGTSAPVGGYLICDGSAVSRVAFAALFAAIGTAYGNGDGSTTFNIPDLRGYFLRGVDNGAGNDPDTGSRTAPSGGNTGDNVGSYQGHVFGSHGHNLLITSNPGGTPGTYGATGGPQTPSGSYIQAAGGNETRPLNAYANYIIKY
jgi:microcystin-dependent protein